jgi:hypothetical protein
MSKTMSKERTVVAVCDSVDEAKIAVMELEKSGIKPGVLSVEPNKVVVTARGSESAAVRDVLNAEGKGVDPYNTPPAGDVQSEKASATSPGVSATDLPPGDSTATTDHDVIRLWAEARNGKPATVKGTADGDEAGLLRIDFPDFS